MADKIPDPPMNDPPSPGYVAEVQVDRITVRDEKRTLTHTVYRTLADGWQPPLCYRDKGHGALEILFVSRDDKALLVCRECEHYYGASPQRRGDSIEYWAIWWIKWRPHPLKYTKVDAGLVKSPEAFANLLFDTLYAEVTLETKEELRHPDLADVDVSGRIVTVTTKDGGRYTVEVKEAR